MKSLTIKRISYHVIALPLVEPLQTSFGVEPDKHAILVEVMTDNDIHGWGEIPVDLAPGYGPETIGTALHVLRNFIMPRLTGQTLASPMAAAAKMKSIRGHHLARAGAEAAVWDAFAKENTLRLVDVFAHYAGVTPRERASVGVSIGIQPDIPQTLALIQTRLNQGYQRIKLKIKPGHDVQVAQAVREAFPDISLMLDANSAYTLADADHLAQLDALNLLMIEQPLAYDDIYEHGQLALETPICLDESIKSAGDVRLALQIGAMDILNLKPCRVGGFTESLEIYRICEEHNLPLWIGGMLETGIGRAANVAFAALPAVTLPSDISATDRYFDPDITEPPFVLAENSTLPVPDAPGIGVTVQPERITAAAERWQTKNPFVEARTP